MFHRSVWTAKKETDAFYVYGHGRLQGTYNTAGKAIQKANDCGGVVIDADQNYIWERGNRDLKYSIDTEDADTEQLRQDTRRWKICGRCNCRSLWKRDGFKWLYDRRTALQC